MKLGLALPNLTPLGTREDILSFARQAEQLGFNSLWVTERLLMPLQPRQLYIGGAWPEVYKYGLDPLDTLIFAASTVVRRLKMIKRLKHHPANAAQLL